jgi:hypothetical protein
MIEDELIKIWQSSSNQERIKFDKSKLMIELQSSLERLHRWWKYLEIVEMISAIIIILSFSLIAYHAPFTPTKIASVLFVIFGVNILIKLFGIKKFKPSDLEESYVVYLNKTKEYLEAQKKLLKTSIYWVILPIYPVMLLFFAGPWQISSTRYLIVVIYLVAIGMGVYGYFLNKKRVKNEINPRITRVNELIKELRG